MNKETNEIEDVFGPVIFSYTRAQAIEDGVLVDVTDMAKQAGIRVPTAVTSAAFNDYVAVPEELKSSQDESGRLWDILWMFSVAVRAGKVKGNHGTFEVIVAMPRNASWKANERVLQGADGPRLVTLKAVCGPGDDGAPCITIMRLDED